MALTPESTEPSTARKVVFGAHGKVIAGRHLIYLSLSGEIKAAQFDPESAVIGRSTTLETGIRRESVTGAGQYAVSGSGTLAYVKGDNAEVGHLVRTRGDGRYEPLPINPAAFQRFDLSSDGRRLAAVIQELSGQELWVYDVETGRGMRWIRAYHIRQPRWDPDGRRILVSLIPEYGGEDRTVIGSPEAAAPPDTLDQVCNDVGEYISDQLILGWADDYAVISCRIEGSHVSVDTLNVTGFATSLSPDGRWIAYASDRTGQWEAYIASFPAAEQRFQVSDQGGLEPLWLSSSELVYRDGHSWYRALIASDKGQPIEGVSPWFSDPRFADTSGFSHLLTADGSLVYVRSEGSSTSSSLRVVPDWLEKMKHAVDDANAN